MKKFKKLIFLTFILLSPLFILPSTVKATTYYVCNSATTCNTGSSGWSTGNDSNNGTSKSTPYATIQKAADVVSPGDTVLVGDGTYNTVKIDSDWSSILRIRRGGTSSAWVTFKAENTWGAKIDGINNVDSCVLFDYPGSPGYIRFEGFDIYNCGRGTGGFISGDGIFINADTQNNCNNPHTHHIYLYKNKIHDVCRFETKQDYGMAGIDADRCTGPITIDSCVFYNIGRLNPDTTPSAPESSCTVPYGSPYSPPSTDTCTNPSGCVFCYNHDPAIYPRGDDVTIINNIFYPDIASGWPIQPWPMSGNMSNLKIINNTFYGHNNHTSYHITLPNYLYLLFNATIENNIFHSPRTAAIGFNSSATVTVKNNLVYGAPIVGSNGCNQSNYTCSGNITDQDPKFVDLANRDFHLQSNSPAINAGSATNAPAYDFDGNPRPLNTYYDIGAYEYPVNQDTEPPTTPTNVYASADSTYAKITVSWTASTDNVAVDHYNLYWCTGSGCTPSNLIVVYGTSYLHQNLQLGTLYRYLVKAVDPSNNASDGSSITQVTTASGSSSYVPGKCQIGTAGKMTIGGTGKIKIATE
jgi:hypothetical protein